MATCHLRLYPRPEQEPPELYEQEPTVSVRLGDLYPVLRQALKGNHAWLNDFENDEVRVTPDFYDVVRAFSGVQPCA